MLLAFLITNFLINLCYSREDVPVHAEEATVHRVLVFRLRSGVGCFPISEQSRLRVQRENGTLLLSDDRRRHIANHGTGLLHPSQHRPRLHRSTALHAFRIHSQSPGNACQLFGSSISNKYLAAVTLV